MHDHIKQSIYEKLAAMEQANDEKVAALRDRISLGCYHSFVRKSKWGNIWTDALQKALDEHEIIEIPASDEPYLIDRTVTIPSNRRIEAESAVIRLIPGALFTMLQNEHMKDGTHSPIDSTDRDVNISINGGIWEESASARCGCPDEKYHTNMLFTNLESLSLTNMTFRHAAGFAVQTGDLKNGLFENLQFIECYADGLHLNGNSENIIARHIKGEVGDDLVALNVYDWQMSSYNFGPMRTVLCEDLDQAPSSPYKALRIEPGLYTYDDGSTVDCALYDAIIKKVRGIRTFKLYFQTPPYPIGTAPERGGVGSADNLFFEDIAIDLCEPIDAFDPYINSDPVRGSFAGFEIGSNIGYICFENIDLTLYKEKYPYSYLVCVGPKSIRIGDEEIFDPYLSSQVTCLEMKNIRVGGEVCENCDGLIRTIEFDDINGDGNSTAKGEIDTVIWNGSSVS